MKPRKDNVQKMKNLKSELRIAHSKIRSLQKQAILRKLQEKELKFKYTQLEKKYKRLLGKS